MKLFSKCLGLVSGIIASLTAFTGCDKKDEEPECVYGPPSYFGIQEDENQVNQPVAPNKTEDENKAVDENKADDENKAEALGSVQ